MSKFWYLVSFNLKKRIVRKAFVIANIIMGIIIIGLINLPSIIKAFGGDFEDKKEYIVYDEINCFDYLTEANTTDLIVFKLATKSFDTTKIKSNYSKYDGALEIKNDAEGKMMVNIYAKDISLSDETNLTSIVNIAKNNIWEDSASQEIKDKVEDLISIVTINKVLEVKSESQAEKTMLAAISSLLITPMFIFVVMIMSFVGTDIIEEKSTRSIEYIISNVEPLKHFGSKIIGALLFVLIQLIVVLGFVGIGVLVANLTGGGVIDSITSIAGGSMDATSTDALANVSSKIPMMLFIVMLFALFGFILYLVLISVFASMSTSMEDFQQFQSPVMICLVVGFYCALAVNIFEGALFIKIIGFIPIFSPMLAPVLYFSGTFSLLELVISACILLISGAIVIYFGAPLYRVSILSFSQDKFFTRIKKLTKSSRYKN